MRLTLDLFGHRLDLTFDRLCDNCEVDDGEDDEDHPQGDVYATTERADPRAPARPTEEKRP